VSPPTVCVAIPVKNGADYLAEAIESVLAQEGVDLSVVVRDNLSSDDSVAIAARYAEADARLTVAVNEEDVGYYGSLNRVLADTGAEFYVPFAADDVMLPGNLARKVEALSRSGGAYAHSSAMQIDASGAELGVGPDHAGAPEVVEAPGFFGRLTPVNALSCQAVLARVDALREIGGFDARPVYSADWLAWLRMALRGGVVTLGEPLVANRVHAASGTSTLGRVGLNGRDIPATLDRVLSDDPLVPAEAVESRDRLMAACLAHIAAELHGDGVHRVSQGWSAYMTMGRALAHIPFDLRLRDGYAQLVSAARLIAPELPFEGVTVLPAGEAGVGELADAVAALGPLIRSLVIAVPTERIADAERLLEPVFGSTELDVVIVPTDAPLELVAGGRVALAPWGSELVGEAEARGVPVQPYALPSPFDRPPDADRWETLEPAAALP
jgi:hypothetical protein